jgi:hypothetical protein
LPARVESWVARWFVYKPKKYQFGQFLEGVEMEDVGIFLAVRSILWPSGIFYGFLVYLKVNWYILPVLVSCSKKNLATLFGSETSLRTQ